MALFRNFYRCPRCQYGWTDVWSATCDDDCPNCGARHVSPHKSADVEETSDQRGGIAGLSAALRRKKLRVLAEVEGFDTVDALIEASVGDSVSPGICTAPECDYTTEVEPDQDRGWCERCGKGTVQSALILAGLI